MGCGCSANPDESEEGAEEGVVSSSLPPENSDKVGSAPSSSRSRDKTPRLKKTGSWKAYIADAPAPVKSSLKPTREDDEIPWAKSNVRRRSSLKEVPEGTPRVVFVGEEEQDESES